MNRGEKSTLEWIGRRRFTPRVPNALNSICTQHTGTHTQMTDKDTMDTGFHYTEFIIEWMETLTTRADRELDVGAAVRWDMMMENSFSTAAVGHLNSVLSLRCHHTQSEERTIESELKGKRYRRTQIKSTIDTLYGIHSLFLMAGNVVRFLMRQPRNTFSSTFYLVTGVRSGHRRQRVGEKCVRKRPSCASRLVSCRLVRLVICRVLIIPWSGRSSLNSVCVYVCVICDDKNKFARRTDRRWRKRGTKVLLMVDVAWDHEMILSTLFVGQMCASPLQPAVRHQIKFFNWDMHAFKVSEFSKFVSKH